MNLLSDCTEFSLIQHASRRVDGTRPINEICNIGRGECFFACFNMTGCYTFSYNATNQRCELYTGCGSSCILVADSSITTYVRQCSTATPGIPLVLSLELDIV